MKKILPLAVILLLLMKSVSAQEASASMSYQPDFLPVQISLDSNLQLKVSLVGKIVTPWGSFGGNVGIKREWLPRNTSSLTLIVDHRSTTYKFANGPLHIAINSGLHVDSIDGQDSNNVTVIAHRDATSRNRGGYENTQQTTRINYLLREQYEDHKENRSLRNQVGILQARIDGLEQKIVQLRAERDNAYVAAGDYRRQAGQRGSTISQLTDDKQQLVAERDRLRSQIYGSQPDTQQSYNNSTSNMYDDSSSNSREYASTATHANSSAHRVQSGSPSQPETVFVNSNNSAFYYVRRLQPQMYSPPQAQGYTYGSPPQAQGYIYGSPPQAQGYTYNYSSSGQCQHSSHASSIHIETK